MIWKGPPLCHAMCHAMLHDKTHFTGYPLMATYFYSGNLFLVMFSNISGVDLTN